MRKYYADKRRLSGEKRICEKCNFTILSMRNESEVCGPCDKEPERQRTIQAIDAMIAGGKNVVLV